MVLRRCGASSRTPSLLHGTDGPTVTTGRSIPGRPVSGHQRLVLWPGSARYPSDRAQARGSELLACLVGLWEGGDVGVTAEP